MTEKTGRSGVMLLAELRCEARLLLPVDPSEGARLTLDLAAHLMERARVLPVFAARGDSVGTHSMFERWVARVDPDSLREMQMVWVHDLDLIGRGHGEPSSEEISQAHATTLEELVAARARVAELQGDINDLERGELAKLRRARQEFRETVAIENDLSALRRAALDLVTNWRIAANALGSSDGGGQLHDCATKLEALVRR